ncbi:hypothetical protein BKK81_17775 [Cupriavidus sp. USMAHM13]|uniref:hypothetical protein n=1 Tax=Cupriavidus sp. USMAHM13 TaxID=1389192 RepID=UPI0008A6CB90|nr:hypothetical protein [Cupriavidus sp. USMAHM13]AOZ00890.1 hypothetical protein BKK81_17775 [Cupriavidus sp. USMAHM13]
MESFKKQIQELDELFDLTCSQLNTEVRATMKDKIAQLKRQADRADAASRQQLASEALRLMASLLSVVTNVMTLWK